MTATEALAAWIARAVHDAGGYAHPFGPTDRDCAAFGTRVVAAIPAGEAEFVGVMALDLVRLGALESPRADMTRTTRADQLARRSPEPACRLCGCACRYPVCTCTTAGPCPGCERTCRGYRP